MSSLKRFSLILFLLAIATFALVSLFDQLIVPQIKPETWLAQTGRILIVLVFGSIIIIFIRRSKPLISKHVGAHPATVFQFFMILIVSIMIIFAVLHTFQVSPTTLLVGGGVVSIVIDRSIKRGSASSARALLELIALFLLINVLVILVCL